MGIYKLAIQVFASKVDETETEYERLKTPGVIKKRPDKNRLEIEAIVDDRGNSIQLHQIKTY